MPVCPHLFLVHVIVSCDDDPLLNPSFRISSLHRLQHTTTLLSLAAFEPPRRTNNTLATQYSKAVESGAMKSGSDRPWWRGLLRRWRSRRRGWASPPTLCPSCWRAPVGGGRENKKKNGSQEKTAANSQIHANSLSKKLSLEVGLSPGEQPDCFALTGETLCLLE